MSFRPSLNEFDFLADGRMLLAPPERRTFLVVEDDFSIQPVWERVIRTIDQEAVICWSTSAEGAERLIEGRILMKNTFDFVIADVMLDGPATGVDLWKHYGESDSLFLFSSGLSPRKFADMIGDQKDKHPFLVRKPLDPLECLESVRAMLAFQHAFRR